MALFSRPVQRRRRPLTALVLVAALAFTFGTAIVWAQADTGCTPSLFNDCLPADLLDPNLLSPAVLGDSTMYQATPAELTAIDHMQNQAITDVLNINLLPQTDYDAVQTWARPEAISDMYQLLVTAAETPGPQRTQDQVEYLAWFSSVEANETDQEAYYTGREYSKWAGITGPAYDAFRQANPNVTPSQLNTLWTTNGVPSNYGPGENQSTQWSRDNTGYCAYVPPLGEDGTWPNSIYGTDAPVQCVQCPPEDSFGCLAPTVDLSTVEDWGAAAAANIDQSPGWAALYGNVLRGIEWIGGLGSALAAGAGTYAGLASAATNNPAVEATLSAISGKLFPYRASAQEYVSATKNRANVDSQSDKDAQEVDDQESESPVIAEDASEEVTSEAAAEAAAEGGGEGIADVTEAAADIATAASGAALSAASAIAALVGLVVEGIAAVVTFAIDQQQQAEFLSGLESYVADPPTPDTITDLQDPSKASDLLGLFVGAAGSPPMDVPGCTTGNNDGTRCLNGTPLKPLSDAIHFQVAPSGGGTATTETTLQWQEDASGLTDSAYASDGWWVDTESDGIGNSATQQSLSIRYVDWSGTERTAFLVPEASSTPGLASSYVFEINDDTGATTTTSESNTIDIIGTDGNDYSVTIPPAALAPVEGRYAYPAQNTTTMALSVSPAVPQAEEPATLTATVQSPGGAPSGDVAFYDLNNGGAAPIDCGGTSDIQTTSNGLINTPVAASDGLPPINWTLYGTSPGPHWVVPPVYQSTATCNAVLPSGANVVYATFLANNLEYEAAQTFTDVTPSSLDYTVTTVTQAQSSPILDPTTHSVSDTYTATMTPYYADDLHPAGQAGDTVTFAGVPGCTSQPVSQQASAPFDWYATCSTTYSSEGSWNVTATFNGDQYNAASTSAPVTTTIKNSAATLNLNFVGTSQDNTESSFVPTADGADNPSTWTLDMSATDTFGQPVPGTFTVSSNLNTQVGSDTDGAIYPLRAVPQPGQGYASYGITCESFQLLPGGGQVPGPGCASTTAYTPLLCSPDPTTAESTQATCSFDIATESELSGMLPLSGDVTVTFTPADGDPVITKQIPVTIADPVPVTVSGTETYGDPNPDLTVDSADYADVAGTPYCSQIETAQYEPFPNSLSLGDWGYIDQYPVDPTHTGQLTTIDPGSCFGLVTIDHRPVEYDLASNDLQILQTPTTQVTGSVPATIEAGAPLTVTTTLSTAYATPPTGTVNFISEVPGTGGEQPVPLCSAAVPATAPYTVSCTGSIPVANPNIDVDASYTGDQNTMSSLYTMGTVAVTPASGSVSVSGPATAKAGMRVKWVAQVSTDTSFDPAGTVTFTTPGALTSCAPQKVNATTLQASCTVVYPVDGKYTASVAFASPNASSASATSSPVTITGKALLESIQITGEAVAVGQQQTFPAIANYYDGSSGALPATAVWASTEPSVATVDSSGVVTGVANGTTLITATVQTAAGPIVGSVLVTIGSPLVSISVDHSNLDVPVGASSTLRVLGVYANGTGRDLTAEATWLTSSTQITLTGSTVAGHTPGSAAVTVMVGSFTASVAVHVYKSVSSMVIAPLTAPVTAGASTRLYATTTTVIDATTPVTDGVTWSESSGGHVARIDPSTGVLTAITPGTTTVTASIPQRAGATVTATLKVTVAAALLTSISDTPGSVRLNNGADEVLQATAGYADGSRRDVSTAATWTSTNTAIVTVNGSTVTAVRPGTTTLTLSYGGLTTSVPVTVSSATLTSVALSTSALTLARTTSGPLTLTGTYSDASTADLTTQANWTSTAPSTASVGANGFGALVVTGTAVGTAQVTASFGGFTASATITVTAATLKSLKVTPASTSLIAGRQRAFSAVGKFSDGTSQDLSDEASWRTDSPSVATIGPDGTATAVAVGTTNVDASVGTVSSSAPLTVTAPVQTAIMLDTGAKQVPVGWRAQPIVYAVYSNGTSSDVTSTTSIISSAPGTVWAFGSEVVALATGSATLTATNGAFTDKAAMTVLRAAPVGITISYAAGNVSQSGANTPLSISQGQPFQLTSTAVWTDGTIHGVPSAIWAVADPNTATITASGKLTGGNPGSTTVTLGVNDVTGSLPLTVTD